MIAIAIIVLGTVIIMTHRPVFVEVMRLSGSFKISTKKKNEQKRAICFQMKCVSPTLDCH